MARKNKKQRKHPKFWLGFKMVLLLFLLTILVGGIIFYFKYGKDIFAMQDDAVALVKESSIDTFRSSETSIVYNNKGKEIAKLKGEKDSYYLTLDKIPKAVKDAGLRLDLEAPTVAAPSRTKNFTHITELMPKVLCVRFLH